MTRAAMTRISLTPVLWFSSDVSPLLHVNPLPFIEEYKASVFFLFLKFRSIQVLTLL